MDFKRYYIQQIAVMLLGNLVSVEAYDFMCKTKPGCQTSHCDPVPNGWISNARNIEEYLEDKEFPIMCKAKKGSATEKALNAVANSDTAGALRSSADGNGRDTDRLTERISTIVDAKLSPVIDQLQQLEKKVSVLTRKLEFVELGNHKDEKQCPEPMIYNDCPSKCPRTCASALQPNICDLACGEPACTCPSDMYLLNEKTQKCVTYKQCMEYCEVVFEGKCYWKAEMPVLATYSNAEALCKQHNASLANVYSKEQIEMFNKEFPKWFVGWTGMSIISKDSDEPIVVNYNGSKAEYVPWHSGYPKIGGGKNNIAIRYSRPERMFLLVNYHPETRIFDGGICEI